MSGNAVGVDIRVDAAHTFRVTSKITSTTTPNTNDVVVEDLDETRRTIPKVY